MDPLHLFIALVPLALYLFLMGAINLSSRPFVSTGSRDMVSLGIAISGLVIAGPMELFLPTMGGLYSGPKVWFLMIGLYVLCVLLVILLSRPRLIIYNATGRDVTEVLKGMVERLDPDTQWAGDAVLLPKLGIQLTIESFETFRNVQLVSTGPYQNWAGWQKLEAELRRELRSLRLGPNPFAISMLGFASFMLVTVLLNLYRHGEGIATALHEMLRL